MLLPLCVGKRRLRASPGRRGQFKTIRIGVAEPNGECKTGSIGQEYSDELCQNRGSLENAEPYRDSEDSYEWFLKEGLKEVFNDVSGITDFNNNLVLDFVDYKLDDKPNYSVSECKERDATYAAASG